MFDVSISVVGDEVIGELVVDSYFFEPSKYEYAYYLYRNGERIDVIWYKKNMNVSFPIKNMSGEFFVKAFIKDIESQDTRNYNSEKITVNS